jgi:hypothetical protein
VLKYIIPAVLAFVFGLLLWQIQKDELGIDYEIVESAVFPRESGNGKYYVVRIRNSGNKLVEKIDFTVAFEVGSVDSVAFSDPKLVTSLQKQPDLVSGIIPLLNPSETFSITITTVGPPNTTTPKIVARAPGVTAIPRSDEHIPIQLLVTIIGIFALAVVGFFSYDIYKSAKITDSLVKIESLGDVPARLERRVEETEKDFAETLLRQEAEHRKRMEEIEQRSNESERKYNEFMRDRKEGSPAAEQIIFALLNKAGISHIFSDLATTGEGVKYWRTGLILVHNFLIDEPNRMKYVSALESLVKIEEMAPSSLGFNLYFLSKMEQFRGNKQKAVEWLERCKTETPQMYSHLMAQDPAYDLELIRQNLLKKTKR